MEKLPIEIYIKIAQMAGPVHDEYLFNVLVSTIPRLGKWTIEKNIDIRRAHVMRKFGYMIQESTVGGVDTIEYFKNFDYHRNDGPAYMFSDGCYMWYKHKKRHGGDPTALIDGEKYWYYNDKLHNTNGPAVIKKNIREFWRKGLKIYEEVTFD